MKPNTHGSWFSEFIACLLWVNNRNALSCNNCLSMFHKTFLGLDIMLSACEEEAESLEWACHPQYTVQGIQNLWEFPEETLTQTSSKKISKFHYVTYTNGWGKREKNSEKTPFNKFFISVITLQIVLKFFPLKPLLIPSPRGQQFPSQGQFFHQGFLGWD